MKVKNIMFSGFAAAILMGVAAEANAAPVAVASKGYVDSIAGTLDDLTTSVKDNLVVAINDLNEKKQAKFDDGDDVTTTNGFISSVVQDDGTVTASATEFDTAVTQNENTAPTSKAVYDAIQGVSGQTTNLDLDAVGGNGKFVQLVSQADGQVSAEEKAFDQVVDDTTGRNTDTAPSTYAVGLALYAKQDKSTADYQIAMDNGTWQTLTVEEIAALQSGISADKVADYDGYATSKQNAFDDGTDATTNNGFISSVVQTDGKVDAAATAFDTAVTAETGTHTNTAPTTAAVYNAIQGVSAAIPNMPDECNISGVTCVMTSEGGVFKWAVLTQPVEGTQDGTAAQTQRLLPEGQELPTVTQ